MSANDEGDSSWMSVSSAWETTRGSRPPRSRFKGSNKPPTEKGLYRCTDCGRQWICEVAAGVSCRRCRASEVVRLCSRCRARRAARGVSQCSPCLQARTVAKKSIGHSDQHFGIGRHCARKVM